METTLDKLWNHNQSAESEKSFRGLLKDNVDDNARAEILTQIARAQGLQGNFDEAHKTLDEVEQLPKDKRVQVRYLLERGRVYHSAKQRDKARPLFLEAYESAKGIHADFYEIDAAHMMAMVEPLEQQVAWHEKALELCETTTDERAKKWLGSITNNAGWTYHDLGRYEEALGTFQKALAWHEVNGKPDTIRIAKWSIARTLRSLQHYEKALTIQLNLLEQDKHDGYIYEELGECLLALNRKAEAEPYLTKARELLSTKI